MNKKWIQFLTAIQIIFVYYIFTVVFLYAKPTLTFDVNEYDFGDIIITEGIIYYDFTFTNTGDEPLQIIKVKSSCGCALADWSRGFIQPGQRGYIRVIFNPKNILGWFTQTVWVLSNDQFVPLRLTITGNVVYPLPQLRPESQPKLRVHKKLKDAGGIDKTWFDNVASQTGRKQDITAVATKMEDLFIRYFMGDVQVRSRTKDTWQPVSLNQIINSGDRIRTGINAKLELEMSDGSVIKINESSEVSADEIRLPGRDHEDKLKLSLMMGKLWGGFKKLAGLHQERIIETPTTVIAVRGTNFHVNVDSLFNTWVRVEDGTVKINVPEFKLEFMLYANQEILIKGGERPSGPIASDRITTEDPGMCLKWENQQMVADNGEDPGACLKCQNGKVIFDNTESPGLCQKCQDGMAIIDDTEEIGACMKCQDGNPVQDDSYKPGVCLKCQNGEVVPDDSEDAGLCKKCQDGQVVADDQEDPGECLKCQNGEVVPDDMEDPGECMKCKNGEVVPDDLEFVNECWKCENGELVPDNTQVCDDGNPCTKNDRCVNGECIGDPVTSSENPDCP